MTPARMVRADSDRIGAMTPSSVVTPEQGPWPAGPVPAFPNLLSPAMQSHAESSPMRLSSHQPVLDGRTRNSTGASTPSLREANSLRKSPEEALPPRLGGVPTLPLSSKQGEGR